MDLRSQYVVSLQSLPRQEGSMTTFKTVLDVPADVRLELIGIPEGAPLAYLIAPPLEAMYALDVAIKAANVRMTSFFGPPSETNFAGAHLTGTQADCQAACDAFADAVIAVAGAPVRW